MLHRMKYISVVNNYVVVGRLFISVVVVEVVVEIVISIEQVYQCIFLHWWITEAGGGIYPIHPFCIHPRYNIWLKINALKENRYFTVNNISCVINICFRKQLMMVNKSLYFILNLTTVQWRRARRKGISSYRLSSHDVTAAMLVCTRTMKWRPCWGP